VGRSKNCLQARERGKAHARAPIHAYDAARYVYDAAWPVLVQRSVWDIYKFTGKERDAESGLDYFGARYDSSSLGRFETPDWSAKPQGVPYAFLNDPQSLNLYSYLRNNPLSKTDPDGHGGCTVDGETHGGVWCWFHSHGRLFGASTARERLHDQAQLMRAVIQDRYGDIYQNGERVDWSKLTDEQTIAVGEEVIAADRLGELGTMSNSPLMAATVITAKIVRQMPRRGWSKTMIDETIDKPAATRPALNKATGQDATAYFRSDGSYVVRDNTTGEIIQISNRNDPTWIPDSSIQNPFKP